jgi:hypothetical protein
MNAEVIIPFAGDDPHRKRAFGWVTTRLIAEGFEVRAANEQRAVHLGWVKANVVMPAIESSEAEIVVMHDADVYCDTLIDAVMAVRLGAAWAIPHLTVYRLTEEATAGYMANSKRAVSFDRRPYVGMLGGGILVSRRDTLLDIPMDPRFQGWGHEDESWSMALACLLGEPWRGTSDLIHLWHPPLPRKTRRQGSEASLALRNQYARAANDPCMMRALLQGAKDARRSALDTSDHRPARG